MRRLFRFVPLALVLMLLTTVTLPTIARSESAPSRSVIALTRPDGRLRKNVDFWISIYSKYSTHEGLVHDSKYVEIVYEALNRIDGGAVRAAKEHWRGVLLSLHRKLTSGETMTAEEAKVYEKFAASPAAQEPDRFLAAAHRKRLRFQTGQRDNFLAGLRASGRYFPAMEEVFRREGVPVELTRLPFVESSFNLNARSKVGASGIWQFMPSTARLFIRVDDAVDERNDPIRAAEAAARLLKSNFDSLGSWPLAVTAYNHGRKGMMRAVRLVGSTELEELADSYRAPSFGFASSNFFTCLLAAVEIERNADKYFGKVERAAPQEAFEVTLPDPGRLPEIARVLKLDLRELRLLNPALSDQVFKGRMSVPTGYQLRLPHDGKLAKDAAARVFLAGYAQIPKALKLSRKRHSM